MATVTRIADAMLSRLVQRGEAGACVPSQGQACSFYDYKCVEHLKYRRLHSGSVSCTGPCTITNVGPWISYTHC
jgi:hypothetical protein